MAQYVSDTTSSNSLLPLALLPSGRRHRGTCLFRDSPYPPEAIRHFNLHQHFKQLLHLLDLCTMLHYLLWLQGSMSTVILSDYIVKPSHLLRAKILSLVPKGVKWQLRKITN